MAIFLPDHILFVTILAKSLIVFELPVYITSCADKLIPQTQSEVDDLAVNLIFRSVPTYRLNINDT